jgi:hypothetical protein
MSTRAPHFALGGSILAAMLFGFASTLYFLEDASDERLTTRAKLTTLDVSRAINCTEHYTTTGTYWRCHNPCGSPEERE